MKKILFTLLLLLFTTGAEAATYWVNAAKSTSTQSCTNSATDPGVNSSSKTVAQGISCASSGDTIKIKSGTYVEGITTAQLSPRSSSSYSAPFTIEAATGETATIRPGSGTIPLNIGSSGATLNFVIFRNLVIDGGGSNATSTDIDCVSMGGGSNGGSIQNIKFDTVAVQNCSGNGYAIGGVASSIWVTGGSIHTVGTSLVASAGDDRHGAYMLSNNNLIERVDFQSVATGYCIHNYEPSALPSNNIYRNNTLSSCGTDTARTVGMAIGLYSGSNNQAYGNIIYSSQNGIDITGTNNKVWNNTLWNNGTSCPSCAYPAIKANSGSGQVIRNNLVIANQINSIDTTGSSGAITSNNITSGSASTYFVDTASNNFSLLSTAILAIDQGTAVIALGITVPACSGGVTINCYNGSAPDIGALESGVPTAGGGPPTMRPNPPAGITVNSVVLLIVDDDDVNERVEDIGDWVGIFAPGATVPPGGAIDGIALFDWFYINGSKTAPTTPISDAVIAFTAPSTPGNYEFRFYQNGSNNEVDRLATTAFTVGAQGLVFKFGSAVMQKFGPSITVKVGVP